jgi:hypothetical protein
MFLLEIDPMQNRLHLTLAGQFDACQADRLCADLVLRLHELRDGFHILCDLSGLMKFDHDAKKHYRRMMDICRENGVRKVIRILPDALNNHGLTIMSHFHYQNVSVVTCPNLPEALEHLREIESHPLPQTMKSTPMTPEIKVSHTEHL